jgi:chromosome segregation ATPase
MEKEKDVKILAVEISRRMNESERRIRYLEQRVERTESSLRRLEEDLTSGINSLKFNLEALSEKISKLKEKIENIGVELSKISEQLKRFATKAEVKQIETFMELISPVTSKFVTRDELERALEKLKEEA